MKISCLLLVACMLVCVQLNEAQDKICSSVEKNIDFKGNDLTFTYDAKSVDACSSICSILSSTCSGFTYWTISSTNSICFLKNFTRTPLRYPASNRQSCIMVRNPNAASTTTSSTTTSTTTSSTSTLSTTTIIPTSSISTDTTTTVSTDTTTSTTSTTTTTSSTTPYTGPVTQPKCLFEANAYYGDALVAFDFRNANTLGDCCDLCAQSGSNCAQFSFLQDNLICYIYSNPLPSKQFRTNTTGGSLNPKANGKYARVNLY